MILFVISCFLFSFSLFLIIFLLGNFGYYDKKIMSKCGSINLLYLPYLIGYANYSDRKIDFDYWGIYIFIGGQGSGKTLSMVKLCHDIHLEHPDVPVRSNLYLKFSDHLNSWEDILYHKDPKSIYCVDELGLWANSKKNAREFSEVLLYLSCQNRKNHRLILTTAQQLYMCEKNLRSQCLYIIETRTIFKILTLNYYYEPCTDADGKLHKGLPRRIKYFLHTQELYSLYDSWEEIQIL